MWYGGKTQNVPNVPQKGRYELKVMKHVQKVRIVTNGMKIIFDIPDNAKCLSVTIIYGDGMTLEVSNATISTSGLYDGQTISIPSDEKDGEQE